MKLGVIGYGARISWIVELIRKQAPECSVAAVVDVRKEGVKRGVRGMHVEDAALYDTPEQMIDNIHLDGVLIGTQSLKMMTDRHICHHFKGLYMHHIPQVRTYEVDSGEDHFGGDAELVRNFIDVMYGRAPSIATLEEGMQSALLCLAAKKSAQTGQFQSIDYEAM